MLILPCWTDQRGELLSFWLASNGSQFASVDLQQHAHQWHHLLNKSICQYLAANVCAWLSYWLGQLQDVMHNPSTCGSLEAPTVSTTTGSKCSSAHVLEGDPLATQHTTGLATVPEGHGKLTKAA